MATVPKTPAATVANDAEVATDAETELLGVKDNDFATDAVRALDALTAVKEFPENDAVFEYDELMIAPSKTLAVLAYDALVAVLAVTALLIDPEKKLAVYASFETVAYELETAL